MEAKEIVKKLVSTAIEVHTSDIFLLPKRDKYQVSFRHHNEVVAYQELKIDDGRELINFFKYAAQMDISEHRRPQVGAMTFEEDEQEYYLRLSSIGDFNDRESLVVRIIYQIKQSSYFLPDQLTQLAALTVKRGLIVTSGPTGSGKTTTMYELAKRCGKNRIVMTIEDPVEVYEKSFLQAQVNHEAGIDYQSLLKAALRHRPDILIVGEIRDEGTARLAIDAALSGHLVLATVHAKSTLQIISRLEGLGISSDELENSLTAVSYQRLIPIAQEEQVACLLDLASGNLLKENIRQKVRGEFVTWQDNLALLEKEGRISATSSEFYQEG